MGDITKFMRSCCRITNRSAYNAALRNLVSSLIWLDQKMTCLASPTLLQGCLPVLLVVLGLSKLPLRQMAELGAEAIGSVYLKYVFRQIQTDR